MTTVHTFVNGGGNLCARCGHALENSLHQTVKVDETLASVLTDEVLERAEAAGFRQLHKDRPEPRIINGYAAMRAVIVEAISTAFLTELDETDRALLSAQREIARLEQEISELKK